MVLKLNIGGALTAYRATVFIGGIPLFVNNTAENATDSDINFIENTIAYNTVRYNGGGISRMQCQFCVLNLVDNRALCSGGGIHAISSTIDIII